MMLRAAALWKIVGSVSPGSQMGPLRGHSTSLHLHILTLLVFFFSRIHYLRNCHSVRKRRNNGGLTPPSSTFGQPFSFQSPCDTSLCSLLCLLCFPAVWKGWRSLALTSPWQIVPHSDVGWGRGGGWMLILNLGRWTPLPVSVSLLLCIFPCLPVYSSVLHPSLVLPRSSLFPFCLRIAFGCGSTPSERWHNLHLAACPPDFFWWSLKVADIASRFQVCQVKELRWTITNKRNQRDYPSLDWVKLWFDLLGCVYQNTPYVLINVNWKNRNAQAIFKSWKWKQINALQLFSVVS